MKLRILIISVSALVFASAPLAPVQAGRMTLEERDALFLACMEARGYTDAAAVMCYKAAYGSETRDPPEDPYPCTWEAGGPCYPD